MSKASSLLFLAMLAGGIAIYPMTGTWLLPALMAYAGLLLWWPRAWLFALPVLVPAMDLAPVTGWFFLEELDLFLMMTAGLCYWRPGTNLHGQVPVVNASLAVLPRQAQFAVALLTLACAISCVRGLLPLAPIDANAFASYLSSYNSLRIAKSWCWAVVLLPLLRRDVGPSTAGIGSHLVPGMLCGLAIVATADVLERYFFPGLLNMSSDYRTSAPFSSMHIGGAALDAYLALTLPLLVYWLSRRLGRFEALATLSLLALGLYAALTTFSRGLYLGLAVSMAIALAANAAKLPRHVVAFFLVSALALGLAFNIGGYRGLLATAAVLLAVVGSKLATSQPGRLQRGQGIATLSILLAMALVIPVAFGSYTGERLGRTASDFTNRVQHWRAALAMMESERMDNWFGVGQGRFPKEYFWHNAALERPASFAYVNEAGNMALRLTPPRYERGYGEVLRILQRIPLSPAGSYVFSVDVRHASAASFLSVHICERQMLYPKNCIKLPIRLKPSDDGTWHRYLVPFQSGRLDGASKLAVVPVQLEIALLGGNAKVDIDRVSIQHSSNQAELVRNGGFTEGSAAWFFSSDHHHLPWHVKNLLLSQYFDQGALGTGALILLIALVGGRLAVRARHGDKLALAHASALAGFLVVGQFDSLLDVPRIALLFYFYLLVASLEPAPAWKRPGS
jgi:hypothetical protein